MSEVKMKMMDGNEAAASVAHRMNEVCVIYPITPSSPMGEWADAWSAAKQKNLWGVIPEVQEMQSEAGAAGACHGAVQAGSLTTTFTASQGLLLMIPNMYKIAGELSPFVMHVAARSLAYHALSIFGDHSDVMSCRQTGFAMLCSNSVQEAHDFAAIAQTSTLRSRVPFMHFFDGFRTSHEIKKIKLLSDDDLRAMLEGVDYQFNAKHALRPEAPVVRGTAQNPDVFFQGREACNKFYNQVEGIVQEEMNKFAKISGRKYNVVDYVGPEDAEQVIVIMGSGAETVEETIEYLNNNGYKVGLMKVRLYRPFPEKSFLKALPKSVKVVNVLDRTKESGSIGEPLYLDVVATLTQAFAKGEIASMPRIFGGRYGLSSKEFTPGMVRAVYDNGASMKPINGFSVGINDDVNNTSLPFSDDIDTEGKDVVRAVFYGLGADGTVGANKNSIKIIAEDAGKYGQGYFVYDSRKSGSMTTSHLRFSDNPIRAAYQINKADFVACHQFPFMAKVDILKIAKPGATFLLNAPYSAEEVWDKLPIEVQQEMIAKKLDFYTINAVEVARETGMGQRINTIMQACFFAISNILPKDEAIAQIKNAIKKTYSKKGDAIVQKNFAAVDASLAHLHKVAYPTEVTSTFHRHLPVPADAPEFVQKVTGEIIADRGNELPVSAFNDVVDGTWPTGTTQYEKRCIATEIPVWDPETCIQCGKCSIVCPHGVIRMKVASEDELKNAPKTLKSAAYKGKEFADKKFILQISPEDCTGCGICTSACPAKNKADPEKKALNMDHIENHLEAEKANWKFFETLPYVKRTEVAKNLPKTTQMIQPLFEFSGACAGCGETPYVKLLTQLFGDRMVVANATGCSSIYSGNLPTTPYAKDEKGHGPAWANSLFEDNAEFGLGMRFSIDQQTSFAKQLLEGLKDKIGADLADKILSNPQTDDQMIDAQRDLVKQLRAKLAGINTAEAKHLDKLADYLIKKSVWILGGDGWAYDIGFGGLDHAIASGKNINILVMDTGVYSNTGGQQSKATPMGASAKFATAGKSLPKKDLGMIAMSYGNVYVAQVSIGANDAQVIKAMNEAEAYDGPSLIIAYSHCIAQGFNLIDGLSHQKAAVESGSWPLYRYNPENIKEGKAPLSLDSKAPSKPLSDYMANETRFQIVNKQNPERYETLLNKAQENVKEKRSLLEYMSEFKVAE
ncbi:MAG: pyruvate:ferredoxin (flavodoxin) oxidoreductase [bacterium]|nr:pyruvate:ferredoxin (flavodoxin) oxidoreductase [bacterium]MDY2830282.1 pyruvate:ferredoxin (flavodoxin) oxidoreductase [Alphaproteobacteria bacterium]